MKRELIGERIFSGSAWSLERVTRENGTGFFQLTNLKGWQCDYPIYNDWASSFIEPVTYDKPETIPQTVKTWTIKKLEKYTHEKNN